jgi:aspartate kinase
VEVFKFGGASVKDANGVKNVAKIIGLHADKSLVIVVSAMGKITNALEQLTDAYIANAGNTIEVFEAIKEYHHQILIELFDDENHSIFDEIANTFIEIDWMLEDEPHPDYDFNYDQIVSIGELLSSKILSAYLTTCGLSNTWLDARGCVQTDNTYREGKVDWLKTREAIQKSIPLAGDVNSTHRFVTQGFIGGTSENFTTTLGREGSDYTAAIFASCLDCPSVTIWKDVPGVLNADPKWFEETEKIDQLSYHDAIELTYYGATVIHPKTIKPLQNKDIKLFVRSFINPEEPGTVISNLENHLPVASFIFKMNQVLISIFPKDFSFIVEENLSQIFQLFHHYRIKINTMQNSAISFSVCVDQNGKKIQALIADLKQQYRVKYNDNLEMVTIRWYNQSTIDRVIENKQILLEVKSRHTCQIVMKGL